MRRELVFEPNAKQAQFLQAKARHVAFGGARGGGKSWAIDAKAILLANRWGRPEPGKMGIKILIVRRTLVDLRNNHIDRMKVMLMGLAKWNQQERKFIFPNGSTISFDFFDSENDQTKYQGVEYDVIFVDEATQMPEQWLKIISTCCRGVNHYPKRVYYTCNPGGPGHSYIKRLFVDRQFNEDENPDDYVFIQALVTDNKALMTYNPEYVQFLRALPPKLRKGWLEGCWDIYEGLFFEQIRDDPAHYDDRRWTHIINPFTPPKSWPVFRSFDWGFNRPFSVGYWAVDPATGVLYRTAEVYGVQYSGKDPIPNVGLKWPPDQLFKKLYEIEQEHPYLAGRQITGVADPSIWDAETGISIAETAAQNKIYFNPGDNRRIPGWMQVQYRLMFDDDGFPQMQVFNTCKNWKRTMLTLEFDEHVPEDLNTKDTEDHQADETRYMAMWRTCKPPKVVDKTGKIDWTSDPLDQMIRGA